MLGITAFNNGMVGAFVSRLDFGFFSDSNRSALFQSAIGGYFRAPILGLGVEPLGWNPHNVILEVFLANGLFFGLIICYLCFSALTYALFIILKKPGFAILPALYIASFLSAMVSGNIYAGNAFWALMASVVGLYFWSKNGRDSSRPSFSNKYREL